MKEIFFDTLLSFTPFWDYTPHDAIHADSPGVYTKEELLKLITVNEIISKCDVIDGSVLYGLRQPRLYSFV